MKPPRVNRYSLVSIGIATYLAMGSVACGERLDARLPSATLVDPLVILFIDNSPGMAAIRPVSGFHPAAEHADWVYPRIEPENSATLLDGAYLDLDALDPGDCPAGFTRGIRNAESRCLRLPSADNGERIYDRRYLGYLFDQYGDGSDLTGTNNDGQPVIPRQTLFQALGNAAHRLVDTIESRQICIAAFDAFGRFHLQAPCGASMDALHQAIDELALQPDSGSPLAGAYHDAITWLRGVADDEGIPAQSPLAYRCQGAAFVVLSDGHAVNDEAAGQGDVDPGNGTWPPTGYALPDWDGRHPHTTSADYLGHNLPPRSDGFGGDPAASGSYLYIDDIAAFGREIDLRAETETDHAGQGFGTSVSGNNEDFAHQYLLGYMVSPNGHGAVMDDAARAAAGLHVSIAGLDRMASHLNAAAQRHRPGLASLASPAFLPSTEGGMMVFRPAYDPVSWTGALDAFRVSAVTLAADSLPRSPAWRAEDGIPGHEQRSLFSAREPDTSAAEPDVMTGIALQWDQLSTQQRILLDDDPVLLQWIQGDPDSAVSMGGRYRDRPARLGPILRAGPVVLKSDPPGRYPDADFLAYRESRRLQNHVPVLFVPSADGLLHAIAAYPDRGHELWAWIPSTLFPRLAGYATPPLQRDVLMDGPLVLEDARIGNTMEGSPWRTLLLGSLGNGGAGVYALDVSDAGSTGEQTDAADRLVWEINPWFPRLADGNPSYPHLGKTSSKIPVIRVRGADGEDIWLAAIPNGLGSRDGATVLYLANLDDGTRFQEIVLDREGGGGLHTVTAVDIDGDSFADRLYAGDDHGRIWRLDWEAESASLQSRLREGNDAIPFFRATNLVEGEERSLPVGNDFALATLPGRATAESMVLLFGTMAAPPLVNQLYAIRDDNGQHPVEAGDLAERFLLAESLAGRAIRTVEGAPFQYGPPATRGTAPGWRMALPDPGEFSASAPILFHHRVLFTTRTFHLDEGADPCIEPLTGWRLELDALTGLAPDVPVVDINGDGEIDREDLTAEGPSAAGTEDESEGPVAPELVHLPDNPASVVVRLEGGTGGGVTLRALPMRPRRHAWRQLDPP